MMESTFESETPLKGLDDLRHYLKARLGATGDDMSDRLIARLDQMLADPLMVSFEAHGCGDLLARELGRLMMATAIRLAVAAQRDRLVADLARGEVDARQLAELAVDLARLDVIDPVSR